MRHSWIFLFLFLGCSLELQDLTYMDSPSVTTPVTLSEACDLRDRDRCLLSFKETYQVGKYTFSPVDIVFILDVSPSTADNFSKISAGFNSLISSIRHFDWRIYFTTADHGDHVYQCPPEKIKKRIASSGQWQSYCPVEDRVFPEPNSWKDYKGNEPKFGKFMPLQLGKNILDYRYLNSNVPLYDHAFLQTLKKDERNPCKWPPFCQGSHEQPLRVMKTILERQPRELIFRPYSKVIFFVVTEEAERKEDPQNATTAQEVLLQFQHAFPNKHMDLIVYGVSIQSQKCLRSQNTWDTAYSLSLDELVKKTDGMSIDICSDDYSPAFQKISDQLRKAVNEVPLSFSPYTSVDVGIDVKVRDRFFNIIKTSWANNKKSQSISFSQILPEGSQVDIQYYYEEGSRMNDLSRFNKYK